MTPYEVETNRAILCSTWKAIFNRMNDRHTSERLPDNCGASWRVSLECDDVNVSLAIPFARQLDAERAIAWLNRNMPVSVGESLGSVRGRIIENFGSLLEMRDCLLSEAMAW